MQKQHADPIHFTNLKKMALSPAHFQESLNEDFRSKDHFKFGCLVHHFLLGAKYSFATFAGPIRRGKIWDVFEEQNRGKDIFKTSEIDHAMTIARATKMSQVAAPFLEGDRELLVEWAFLKRSMSSRIDVLNDYVVDFKTTQCSKPEKFRWEIEKLHYNAQLAMYQDAARYIGRETKGAIIIACEKEAPYAVTVFELSPAMLEEGRKLNRVWMERLIACERANEWPAYTQCVVPVDLRPRESVTLLIDGEEVAA